MNLEEAKSLLKKYGQTQLLDYYTELDGDKQRLLLNDIQKIDFDVLENINKSDKKGGGEILPIPAKTLEDTKKNFVKYTEEGLKLLRGNKVGAVLLAGGQGTRLGYDKPKGMFNIGETRYLSIFEQQMTNIKYTARLSGNCFPLFIMTSAVNNDETVKFFIDNNFFGYPAEKVHFFIQKTQPVCGFDGKIFLSEKHRVAQSPNGNGGWYSSLVDSGLGEVLESEGIEWINVYAVDNVLQKICDPAFVGAASLSGYLCAAKVVKKTCPEERVGVLCMQDGKPRVIEYYEMPPELAAWRGEDGELVLPYGVILNYLFSVSALNTTLSKSLPYHLAKKAVSHIENGVLVKPDRPNGYKFETLVVDMVNMTGNCLAYEVEREKEFAPVKNRTGVDSVDTARALLKLNGVQL